MTNKKEGAEPMAAPWTDRDIATAAAMWRDLMTEPVARGEKMIGRQKIVCAEIGQALGRTAGGVQSRFRDCGVRFSSRVCGSRGPRDDSRLDPGADRLRTEREAALAQQSPVAAMMGDPPPGYSALDDKRRSFAFSDNARWA